MPEYYAIEQWQQYEDNDWWKWAVWIEGRDEALDRVKLVEWILHPTFVDPIRRIVDRKSKFRLETGGWGVFPIVARLDLKDGSKIKLHHDLDLRYPDGRQTTA